MDKEDIIDTWEETIEHLREKEPTPVIDGKIAGIQMCIRQLQKWGK